MKSRPQEQPCLTCRWLRGTKCVIRKRVIADGGDSCPEDLWDPHEEHCDVGPLLRSSAQLCLEVKNQALCASDSPGYEYGARDILGDGCYRKRGVRGE